MTIRAIFGLLVVLLMLAGCSVNQEVSKAYIQTTDTVGKEWIEYVNADDKLTDRQRDRRQRKWETMNLLRDKLAAEQDEENGNENKISD